MVMVGYTSMKNNDDTLQMLAGAAHPRRQNVSNPEKHNSWGIEYVTRTGFLPRDLTFVARGRRICVPNELSAEHDSKLLLEANDACLAFCAADLRFYWNGQLAAACAVTKALSYPNHRQHMRLYCCIHTVNAFQPRSHPRLYLSKCQTRQKCLACQRLCASSTVQCRADMSSQDLFVREDRLVYLGCSIGVPKLGFSKPGSPVPES